MGLSNLCQNQRFLEIEHPSNLHKIGFISPLNIYRFAFLIQSNHSSCLWYNKKSTDVWMWKLFLKSLKKIYSIFHIWALRHEKTCHPGFANNTGADQPAHPRSLISACVVPFLESSIMLPCYRWNFNFLASLCSWGDWFETRFVGNPEDRFCRDETKRYTEYKLFGYAWVQFIGKGWVVQTVLFVLMLYVPVNNQSCWDNFLSSWVEQWALYMQWIKCLAQGRRLGSQTSNLRSPV